MLLDKSVDYIPVLMVHEDPKNYPHVEPAEGYTIRGYLPGDEEHWARIECAVGQFDDYEKARACFVREFLSQPERAATNCLFAIAPNGMPVGMLSLWYGGILGRFPGCSAVADGNMPDTVAADHTGKDSNGFLLFALIESGVDHVGAENLAGCIHNGNFATVAVAGVQAHGHEALHGRLHQQRL